MGIADLVEEPADRRLRMDRGELVNVDLMQLMVTIRTAHRTVKGQIAGQLVDDRYKELLAKIGPLLSRRGR